MQIEYCKVKKVESHQLQAYDIRVTTCHHGWSVKDAAAEARREECQGCRGTTRKLRLLSISHTQSRRIYSRR